jgi:hypothetical protein
MLSNTEPCMFSKLKPSFRMRAIVGMVAFVLFSALSLAAQGEQAFKGSCVRMGGKYVLSDGDNHIVYQLDNQRKPKPFADRNVVIIGTLDKTLGIIHIAEIMADLSRKVTQARSVFIDCDNCLRTMANAPRAAFEELSDWGRFDVVPNRKDADLIFLFSSNPYLGNYVTRDGPDTRPVAIATTFMNVIDPATGENLWGDSKTLGAWRVAAATKDLVVEFKEHLEASEDQVDRLLFLMDKDGDGKISKQEFLDFMGAEFDRLDTHKDGELNANELKQLRVVNVGK